MKKRKILLISGTIFLSFLVIIFTIKFFAQQCTEHTMSFTENFDTEVFKDIQNCSVANWPPGPIRLNYLGANFQVTEPAGMGAKIYVCDAGDFDGDGYPDLIGLDIANNYRLILVRNLYNDANGDGRDDDGIIFRIDPNEVYDWGLTVGPASITVADYNNDGLLDFFFYKNQNDSFSYNNFVAAMYINVGTKTDPHFRRYFEAPNLNFTQRFQQAGIYCNWAADHLCSVDIDKDGDMDVLVISQDKIFLVRNPGPQNFNLNAFQISELNYDQRTGFTVGRGGSSIDAADFDNDGDIDVVGGTVNDLAYLVYYENDGTGYFIRKTIPIPNSTCTGTVATCIADFKKDGWKDIFGATDRWNAGNEARMWLFKNNGLSRGSINWTFRCLNQCDPILPPPHDVDMSASLDYDQDGDMDVILADANHSGDYYLVINELAPVYALYGQAVSKGITSNPDYPQYYLNPDEYAITKVRVKNIQMRVQGGSSAGLSVNLYISNDSGQNWELYARWEGSDIKNYSNLDWHTFDHFGSQLKWKAILQAPEDQMAEYQGASFETPEIGEIELEWTYVEKREYSRTSVVATTIQGGGQTKKLVIAGSFIFPGWQGHLRAYDVTNLRVQSTPNSVLQTVSTSSPGLPGGRTVAQGVSILWDAGELLRTRPASSRTIYTAIKNNNTYARLDFTAANEALLATYLQDFNNNNSGLINFVRGEGRDWKLGDINHSNPIVVGPPEGNPALMGTGYDTFKNTWSNRRKVIYVGANDGMLHCFDGETGEELWGFIPFNLLPKLRNMWRVDSSDPENVYRYFQHDFYVDGTPVVADVYINNTWKTVLICGQGQGSGSSVGGGLNYYFALDVTDPSNPQPLWEFTHSGLGETWSIPVVGRIQVNGAWTWVAFMGSGYDNNPSADCGNYFYAVNIADGTSFWNYVAPDVNTVTKFGLNIPNAIPGSPSIVDINSDGKTDRVYFADLDGRVYRLDCSIPYEPKGKEKTSWDDAVKIIYTDPMNFPIISKPLAYLSQITGITSPRIYFGTGGDDRTPSTYRYSFIALNDTGSTPATVEWFVGDHLLLSLPASKDKGDLGIGEKVWADPVVNDNLVYFSTLQGSIESVDPCANLQGTGRLYARFILNLAGSPFGGGIGSSALMAGGSSVESLALASKSRAAVTLGERQRTETGERKREVYIQEYDSTIQRLEQSVGALLRVKSWREVYKVIR